MAASFSLKPGNAPTALVTSWLACVVLQTSVPFLVPVHRYPVTTFDSEWAAAIVLGLASILAAATLRTRLALHASLPAIAIALPVLGAIHYALGWLHYTYSLSSLGIAMAAMFAAYLMGRALVAMQLRERAVRAACIGLLVGGLFSVAIQLQQVFDLHLLPAWLATPISGAPSARRPFGNLAQPNHLATYLVWAAVACLHLGAERRTRWQGVALALIFCGLALTGSRMGALFGVGVLALALVPNPIAHRARADRIVAAFALASGYAAGLALTALFLVDPQGAMSNALERFAEGSFGQRTSMWADAWRIAWAHPLLGVGVGEYGGAQYLAARADPALLATNNPHDMALHVAAEFGLPAAVLIVVALVAWARCSAAALAESPRATATSIALVGFALVHALLEYPLWHLFFAIVVALFAALAEPARAHGTRWMPGRLGLAAIGGALLSGAVVLKADYDEVAAIWAVYLQEIYDGRPHDAATAARVSDAMGTTFFKPQLERLYVEVLPLEDQAGEANLALVGRVLTRLADVRVVTRYVELLLQAGRLEETTLHIERLRLFAGAQYPALRDEILASIADKGPRFDPVRRALAAP